MDADGYPELGPDGAVYGACLLAFGSIGPRGPGLELGREALWSSGVPRLALPCVPNLSALLY